MGTAFVLSGGASLGAVQVGMLQALIGRGIRPDLIVGSSVGAVNGAWLAGGAGEGDVEQLAEIWCRITRRDVFPTSPLTSLCGIAGVGNHLVPDRGVRRLLRHNLRFANVEDAPIPLHVVATDVLSGSDVRLSTGNAIDAVAASAAIPGIFPAVTIDGQLLMDGGVVDNTPISHAVALGATTVWVLPTGAACGIDVAPRSALGMALHGILLAICQQIAFDIGRYENRVELKVVPPLCPLTTSPTDFSHAAELIDRARTQTAAWLDGNVPVGEQSQLLTVHSHLADRPGSRPPGRGALGR